ncbi:MAG: DUF983 domain-containing protein [Pseudomonadota bacterium]
MTQYPSISPYAAGIGGKCPRCGEGRLFEGFLGLKENCEACGLDFAKADAGDGPAVFVIFIAGFVGVAIAFIARYTWLLPMWAAFAISIGVVVASVLGCLRPMKATLIALQYAHKAAEGRLEE